MKNYIYDGKVEWIDTHDDGDNDIGIKFVKEVQTFNGTKEVADCGGIAFCKHFEDELGWGANKYASVRFYTSNSPINPETVEQAHIEYLLGIPSVEWSHCYSDYTGYLWTDKGFSIGGHDLREILISHVGEYIHFEMELYNKKEVPQHILDMDKQKGKK